VACDDARMAAEIGAINMADHKLVNAAVAQVFPDLPAAS